jgi:hypothetical protein
VGLYASLRLTTTRGVPSRRPDQIELMKKIFLLALTATCLTLCGCGSDSAKLTSEEQQNFKGGGSGERSPEAAQGIADFKKKWEEKHGTQTPSQARIPGGG